MRRALLTAAALCTAAIPATATVVVASSSPAFAVSSLTCGSVKGTATGTITIKKCSVVPKILKKDYKSASGATGTLANGGAITWKGGETTIVGLPTVTLGGTACPAGSNEATGTSTVVGGTATLTPVGDTVVVSVCISAKGKVSLAPGTQVQL